MYVLGEHTLAIAGLVAIYRQSRTAVIYVTVPEKTSLTYIKYTYIFISCHASLIAFVLFQICKFYEFFLLNAPWLYDESSY